MLGFSKLFAIVVFIAGIISFGLRDYRIGIQILIIYAIAKIVWNVLTKK